MSKLCFPILGAALLWGVAQAQPRILHFTLERQLPLMKAEVDGHPARLLLDLGGAAALALRPDWPGLAASAQLTVNGGASETVPARPWPRNKPPPGVDGYLGYGYLARHSLVIDYAQQQVRLYPPGRLADECSGPVAALQQLGSLPYARFEQQGTVLPLGLDTGANQNVLRREAALQPGALMLEGVALEPGPFGRIDLAVPLIAGFLGHDFFARHRVCLDASSKQLQIEP
jgi:hypothetical protein